MGKQRAVLHHHADAPLVGGHRLRLVDQALAIERDASRIGGFEAGDQAQQCSLATARRADNGGAAHQGNAQIDAVQRRHRAVTLAQARHLQKAHRPASRFDCRKSSQVSGSEITIMIKA
jgi:hypothetical protein